jgi:hypothetical protein
MECAPASSPRPAKVPAAKEQAMLVAGVADDPAVKRAPLSKLHVLKMVGRRSLPSLIEATIIPSVLFYVFLVTVGPAEAMLAALTWAYGSVLRRYVSGQRIPGVLQLAVAASRSARSSAC